MFRRRTAALLGLLGLSAGAAAPGWTEPCALVSAAEVGRLLGQPVTARRSQLPERPGPDDPSVELQCGYAVAQGSRTAPGVVLGAVQANPAYAGPRPFAPEDPAIADLLPDLRVGAPGRGPQVRAGAVPGLPGSQYRLERYPAGTSVLRLWFNRGQVAASVLLLNLEGGRDPLALATRLARLYASRLP